MKMSEWLRHKLLLGFPDAIIDESAGTITLNTVDVMNLIAELESLRYGPIRPEPSPYAHYREGSWLTH